VSLRPAGCADLPVAGAAAGTGPYLESECVTGCSADTTRSACSYASLRAYRHRSRLLGRPRRWLAVGICSPTRGRQRSGTASTPISSSGRFSKSRASTRARRVPAGAQGIAQFMPATAQGHGRRSSDPYASLDGAARLMKQHLDRYGWRLQQGIGSLQRGPWQRGQIRWRTAVR